MNDKELGFLKAKCLDAIWNFENRELKEARFLYNLDRGKGTPFEKICKVNYDNMLAQSKGMRNAYFSTFGEEVPDTLIEIQALASRLECPF